MMLLTATAKDVGRLHFWLRLHWAKAKAER